LKTRFIIVGTGNRGLGCFAKGLMNFPTKGREDFPRRAEIVAFVDANLTRARAAAREIGREDLPVARSVAEAARAAPADWCIVTTPDFTHRKVVVEALKAGLNVLVDKPLATSAWECDEILSTMRDTGLQVIVGHNMRYSRGAYLAAREVWSGRIGKVLAVEAAEVLDYSHGGDYFHRWHSDFSKSAGLMNHKCCHHLDVLCWILDDEPVEVAAWGGRGYYRSRPDIEPDRRCSECPIAGECPHYFNMDKWDGVYRRIYKQAEGEDGYIRDRCVFSDRHTINDHETANIRFAGGTLASFSLVSFAPREFAYFYFTGTAGRLEFGNNSPEGKPYLRITDPDGKTEQVSLEVEHGEHGHGGSDLRLIADLLDAAEGKDLPDAPTEPQQRARPEEARRAVLIADLCARSIAAGGRPARAEEAGKDYPPAPPQPD